MKATKKIVGAACALVAAVALSAGSTFAWFSSNSEVEVTGMRLQAVIPDALFIERHIVTDASAITKTSLDFEDDSTTKLNPATIAAKEGSTDTYEVKSAKTYEEGKEPSGTSAGTAATYDTHGSFDMTSDDAFTKPTGNADASPESYATIYTMSVARINNKDDDKLQAKVVFTFKADDTDDNTYKFVRCGFLSRAANETTATPKFTSIANTAVEGSCEYNTGAGTVTFTYSGDNAVISDFDGNTAYIIQFVVWFDGPDDDCYVNNALNTNEITVKITYTVEKGAATPTPEEEETP